MSKSTGKDTDRERLERPLVLRRLAAACGVADTWADISRLLGRGGKSAWLIQMSERQNLPYKEIIATARSRNVSLDVLFAESENGEMDAEAPGYRTPAAGGVVDSGLLHVQVAEMTESWLRERGRSLDAPAKVALNAVIFEIIAGGRDQALTPRERAILRQFFALLLRWSEDEKVTRSM